MKLTLRLRWEARCILSRSLVSVAVTTDVNKHIYTCIHAYRQVSSSPNFNVFVQVSEETRALRGNLWGLKANLQISHWEAPARAVTVIPLLLVLIFKRCVQMLKLISSYAAMQTRADADHICPISMFASMQSLFAVKSCRKNCPSAAWICKSVTICHFTTIGCAAKTLLSINVLLSYLYIPMLMKLNQWHLTCLKWCKPRDNESVVAIF